ncbi:glycosyltransferase family 4 protein [Paenibacillus hamazuiensis]|uniref:glycosyltransferase family 4 protein n=1 Tax=Paenibacillus hamazuiensis TaxID=2936508 RepID=UPI00200E523E|nr:glycosyltransferase family 4 protein [Paenibacillus hamazuiensis]
MNIAFYNHTSVVSGAEISLLLTARNLSKARPFLFVPEGELLERAKESGLPVISIPSYRARLSKNPFRLAKDMLGMAWAGYKFAQTIRRHEIDLIHANSLRAGIMAVLFSWLHRRPVIWHVRDIPPQGVVGRGINQLAKWTVQALVGISQSVLAGFDQKKLGDKLHLVHNGVELQEIAAIERLRYKKNIRQELNTPMQSHAMVIIGQITPWKRQIDAIRAAYELRQAGHDVHLWVVGEAKFRQENIEYMEKLKRLASDLGIEDRVRFTGFRNDVLEICCAADLLFLCSDSEPFGRVIIEAMSQSIPVVGTNAGGVPEIIVHNHCGLLYEVGDVEELVQCASRLLTDSRLRQLMGSNAARRVREHFTIQSTVDKVEKIYAQLLSGGSRVRAENPEVGRGIT